MKDTAYKIVDIVKIDPNWSDITFWIRPKACPWIKEQYKVYVQNRDTVCIVRPSFGENWNAGWKWLVNWPLHGCGKAGILKVLNSIYGHVNLGRPYDEIVGELYALTVELRKLEVRYKERFDAKNQS